LQLAEKLQEFAKAGLPIVFAEHLPAEEISFKDYSGNGQRIQKIMQELTGIRGASSEPASPQGHGSVRFIDDATAVPRVLQAELNVSPNLHFATPEPQIFFQQFDVDAMSFFFFRNPLTESQDFRVTLPAGKRIPQIWNPWTGEIGEAPVYRSDRGSVTLEIHLDPYGSQLIGLAESREKHAVHTTFPKVDRTSEGLVGVTTEPGSYHTEFNDGKNRVSQVSEKDVPLALTLGPNWELNLLGNDKDGKQWSEQIHAAPLRDWSLSQNLRYFSGQGHYNLDVQIAQAYLRQGLALELDLGEVHDVAEVWINNKKVDFLIMRPYRVNVAPYLKVGSNHLEIVVTNTLRNRLVGDGASGDPHFVMFQRRVFFMPSGLIGPVRLIPEARVKLE